MGIWEILGIDPTKDENLIKQAYMKMLPHYHPEEDQEGFRRLREAYEKALMSLQDDESQEDRTPSGLAVQEFIQVYQDFNTRIDPQAWQKVLDLEVCQRIDSQQEVGEKLLVYLMDYYYIPQSVWQLLAAFFCWEEYQETLQEKFPPGFLNFVFDSIRYEDMLRYELFPLEAGLEYDRFIRNFFAINDGVNESRLEQVEQLISETDGLNIVHPDYTLLKLRYHVINHHEDQILELTDPLYRSYPEDVRVLHGVAQGWLRTTGPDAALPLFEKVLEKMPEHFSARYGLANCYFQKEAYAVAKEKYLELLREYPYDTYIGNAFYETNEKLIPLYEASLAENPQNQETIYKLASCYHNCRRFADSCTLLAAVVPDEENAAKHHELYAYALMETGEIQAAAEHFHQWEVLEEDRQKLAAHLPLSLLELGLEEEALLKSEELLPDYPQEAALYDTKAGILRNRHQLNEALEVIEEGLRVKSDYLSLHIKKAEIHFDLENYGESLDSARTALQIYPYLYNMLLLQMKIFYQVDNYEEVLRLCEQADQYGMEDSRTELYRSLAHLAAGTEVPASIEQLEKYLETDPGNPLAVYAVKEYYEDREELDTALSCLDRAIAVDPENIYFRFDRIRIYKWQNKMDQAFAEVAWLEKNHLHENADFYNEKGLLHVANDEPEAARSCYEKAIELNAYDRRAHGNLADLLAQLDENESALEHYTRQLEIREHPYYYLSRGLVYSDLKKTAEEKADYLKAIEIDPDYAYAYNNVGIVLYDEENFEEALTYFAQALERDPGLLASRQYTARSWAVLDEVDKALQSLEQGIGYYKEQDHTDSVQRLYLEILNILKDRRRYQDALALYPQVPIEGKGQAELLRSFGYCAYEAGQDAQAKKFFSQAQKIDKDDAETYRKMGYFYLYGLKKIRKAVDYCRKAVQLNPDNYENHLQLAKAYETAGKHQAAVQHFSQALELLQQEEEKRACEYCYLGECYLGLGQSDQAQEHFLLALEKAEHYPHCTTKCCYKSLLGMARLSEKSGDYELAEHYYDKAAEIMPDREYLDSRKAFLKRRSQPAKKGLFGFWKKRP